MFRFARRLGWIGGLAALARSPMGQRFTASAKGYLTNPENRRKLTDLRARAMRPGRKEPGR